MGKYYPKEDVDASTRKFLKELQHQPQVKVKGRLVCHLRFILKDTEKLGRAQVVNHQGCTAGTWQQGISIHSLLNLIGKYEHYLLHIGSPPKMLTSNGFWTTETAMGVNIGENEDNTVDECGV